MNIRILVAALFVFIGAAHAEPVTLTVTSTAYNSIAGQTDATPFITATGTRTRPGVVAVSRDLLRRYPYGSRLKIVGIVPTRSCGLKKVPTRTYVIEDTMNRRMVNKVDIWMESRNEAMNFGKCQLKVQIF